MRRLLTAVPAVALLAAAGCGDNLLHTTGRVVKGGAAFVPPGDDYIRVVFIPLANANPAVLGDTFLAEVKPEDSTFRVVGKDGRGLPPGKYRVAIDYVAGRKSKTKDPFQGRFAADKSPFEFDIDSGTKEVVLDLDKK